MNNKDLGGRSGADAPSGSQASPAAPSGSAPSVSIPNAARTKSLDEVKSDMSELYDLVRAGGCDLKLAGELANITGKFLKAEQLIFAREVFLANNLQHRMLSSDAE